MAENGTTGAKPTSEAHAQLEAAHAQLQEQLKEAKERQAQILQESFSLFYGQGGGTVDLAGDPRFDHDGEAWDEVGIRGGGLNNRARRRRGARMIDVTRARSIGRMLSEDNEFVIGAMKNRVSYIVGEGVTWRAVPRDRDAEDPAMTRAVGDLLEAWQEQERGDELDQETVWRLDRDGEARWRIFVNADGLPRVRFFEPELLAQGPAGDGPRTVNSIHTWARRLGVDVDPHDTQTIRGYYVREASDDQSVQYVPAWTTIGIPHVVECKLNVDRIEPRGWPTFWSVRRNMARAEKLLRNASYVAALQASIALIRKHDRATKSQVENFLDNHRDLLVTNNQTGKDTRFSGLAPGTVFDVGPGTTYEAPVSSTSAYRNVAIIAAELRAAAASVVQPEYMLAADTSSGGYASTLVADGPPSKNFRRLQRIVLRPLRELRQAAVAHEVFWGRLDPRILERYQIVGDPPTTVVRNLLQEAQRHQILFTSGVLSRTTWASKEGLDPDEEQRHFDREAAAGFTDPRTGADDSGADDSGAPPVGQGEGGPGGADQKGPANPAQASGGDNF